MVNNSKIKRPYFLIIVTFVFVLIFSYVLIKGVLLKNSAYMEILFKYLRRYLHYYLFLLVL